MDAGPIEVEFLVTVRSQTLAQDYRAPPRESRHPTVEMLSHAAPPKTRELDRNTSRRTNLRLCPSVNTNSRARRYLPLCGSRTMGGATEKKYAVEYSTN